MHRVRENPGTVRPATHRVLDNPGRLADDSRPAAQLGRPASSRSGESQSSNKAAKQLGALTCRYAAVHAVPGSVRLQPSLAAPDHGLLGVSQSPRRRTIGGIAARVFASGMLTPVAGQAESRYPEDVSTRRIFLSGEIVRFDHGAV